jgi:5'-methylthioadenosine phosphorylase
MADVKIGVIGGSGLYEMEGLSHVSEVRVPTPFGDPSDAFMAGDLDGVPMVFLPRHGRGHRILPTELNFRANLWAMKKLGVTHIVSVSACGSMREQILPGHLVVVDQFVDRTRTRVSTFFGRGIVAHVQFADPVCPFLSALLFETGKSLGVPIHPKGTYVCMEGPQFSTRAESLLYRSWGVDVIGMTNVQEAKLAREAEIAFATLALATDFDCWHPHHEDVDIQDILRIMAENVANAKRIIRAAAPKVAGLPPSPAHEALKFAIITDKATIPAKTREDLGIIIGKYVG